MGFFYWLWIARPLKVMSIVSFSFVNWTLSVVMDRSLAYCGSSLLYSITEENRAAAKAPLLQKLELQSHVVRQGWFATAHYDR